MHLSEGCSVWVVAGEGERYAATLPRESNLLRCQEPAARLDKGSSRGSRQRKQQQIQQQRQHWQAAWVVAEVRL